MTRNPGRAQCARFADPCNTLLLDLKACVAQLGIAFGQRRVALGNQRIALRQQGAQRLHVVGKCRGVELGGHT